MLMKMASNGDKWMRIFDCPETTKHKKGFTIYKIISLLYPESCPDAITKLTVWKRFNEFKKLHGCMKSHHKALKLKDKFPSLPTAAFFKRFDSEVIEERRLAILTLLEYIGKQHQLFTSEEFVKFFQTSHTPNEVHNSSISTIRAELRLPSETEFFPFRTPSSDDEHTLSDTDSVSTLSSVTNSLQAPDLIADPLYKSTSSLTKSIKRNNSESSCTSIQGLRLTSCESHDSLYLAASFCNVDGPNLSDKNIFPTPPSTPNLINPPSLSQYILDASKHINLASQYECDKKYEEAFNEYKLGIDILLKHVKEDKNIDRREMVRFKTERYLLRAEKIYNLHLSSEIRSIQQLTTPIEKSKMEYKPLSELYKYKVIKVISSGMLVLHSEHQKLYYVKVIQKTMFFCNDYLVLPDHVPYMVKLYNFYNCENALFLVLQFCSGTGLLDYIKQRSMHADVFDNIPTSNRLRIENSNTDKDSGSDCSYIDLINDYALSKNLDIAYTNETSAFNQDLIENNIIEDESLRLEDSDNTDNVKHNRINDEEQTIDHMEVNQLLEQSQKLLSSIDITLHEDAEQIIDSNKPKRNKISQDIIVESPVSSRKYSDKSVCDEFDDMEECPLASYADIVKWAAQIVLALEKLHSLGVVCCDLKMSNLLIDEDGDIILTYMCRIFEKKNIHIIKSDVCIAPELFTFENVSCAADWWSLGVILYELLVGIPFDVIHPEIPSNHTLVKIPKTVFPEGRSLLKQLLTVDPTERLGYGLNGTEEIKSHPFFSTICWKTLFSKYLI